MKKTITLTPKKKKTMTLTKKPKSQGMNFPRYAQDKALKTKNKRYLA